MRRWAVPTLLAVVATACSTGTAPTEPTATTAAPNTTTAAPTTTEGAPATDPGTSDPTTTGAPATTAAPVIVDGPPAPDFTLALQDPAGETFVLSAEEKPVYMVFWAEW